MEPSKEAIAVRLTRLNRQILGKTVGNTTNSFSKRAIERETLLDALTVLYNECNEDPIKKSDEIVRAFVDKYRSSVAELRKTRVCIADFELLQSIGKGHFGEVHMVREKQTGDVYALKTLRKEIASRRATACTDDERDVLATNTAGPWLPKLQYAFQDSSNLYLVMELCSGGDLAGLLARRNHPLTERDAAFYIAEIAHALQALHDLGYVHRDVKPHNILLDRCGHVKLGDFGSSARLAECGGGGGGANAPALAAATPDYVAPELLAVADCAQRHTSACDYWSLGVIAFELVTLRRPFSKCDNESIAKTLCNIQKYEREGKSEPPFDPLPASPSADWRSLVAGLLQVAPSRRLHYLDTLQHKSLRHLAPHQIRDQVPPWVPMLRGPEDASYFVCAPREPAPPSAASFRARAPFAGQLPFIGFSFVASEDHDDSHTTHGFNASLDCTAIDLATFKSAEKLAAMRAREVASLQSKLAAAEASVGAEVERARRSAEAEAEVQRARLQAEITALSLQNRRLERQVEVEKEERIALERSHQESALAKDRNCAELRRAQDRAAELETERHTMRENVRQLESKLSELQLECDRALASADTARMQQKHYKDIIEHAQQLRHRRLTEINVRPIDTIAKERALRRQTLCGGEAESRELGTRLAAAEAKFAKESRAKDDAEARLAEAEQASQRLRHELDAVRRELARAEENHSEKQRVVNASTDELKTVKQQLTQERVRSSTLLVQVQELQRSIEEANRREAALEEQCARTEARVQERLLAAEARAADALKDDARHREKVNTLEQLVRQLEREVSALEARGSGETRKKETASDTESVDEGDREALAHSAAWKEQLERAEAQLQARADEIAALRQEARSANLARWRKEREFNDLSVEMKSQTRDLKRAEERLTLAAEARKAAEQKASTLQSEIATLRPQWEQASKELGTAKERLERLRKVHETAQAEVDRSRNDILKLKCELQYSEQRRIRAEQQEQLASRERAVLRDENHELRAQATQLEQNNKALQEACSLLEEQLTDLEKLSDIHEVKNNDIEGELQRVREELNQCREQLTNASRSANELSVAASLASRQHEQAREQASHANCQLRLLTERLESRESRVAELESRLAHVESAHAGGEAALTSAMRRVRELQEECADLRSRALERHSAALRLHAQLSDAQEEIAAAREAADAAAAWWRTRETKADATLRQQAKLIDFLQAKVEEAKRKKCSLSNKLFGRSGRRPSNGTSPPLRRVNRELREEVDRLRKKLAVANGSVLPGSDASFPATPVARTPKPINGISKLSIDTPDGYNGHQRDSTLQVLWSDGLRDITEAYCSEGAMVIPRGGRQVRARLMSTNVTELPPSDASKAFTIRVENPETGPSQATVVCRSIEQRGDWLSRLTRAPAAPLGAYSAQQLLRMSSEPCTAHYVGDNALAIGTCDGLHSLRGAVRLQWAHSADSAHELAGAVESLVACAARAVMILDDQVVHGGLLAFGSALRRASGLSPVMAVSRVRLPDSGAPHLLKAISGESNDQSSSCLAVACGRRVFLLRYDAAAAEFRPAAAGALSAARPPAALLLTPRVLYVAADIPLRTDLPATALEPFAMDEPIIAAAAKKHSPPKAILLIREKPLELLICYNECGVFLDENGKRTRSEDPKWASAVNGWEFVRPFLYLVGKEDVVILCITDEAYRSPPCTCTDTHSLASTPSECYMPEKFTLKMNEPQLLGAAPNGIIVRSRVDDEYSVSLVEGMAAFRSIGASIESLETVSDIKGSLTDIALSMTDLTTQEDSRNTSRESVEPNTGFLADIRSRARQLRMKNRKEPQTPDDVIKEILTTEVGLKRQSGGRMSPASVSEFSSDESSDEVVEVKTTADVCAEMFTRQVRFQK